MLKAGAGPTAIFDFLRTHEEDYSGSLSAIKRLCVSLRKNQGPKPQDVAIPITTSAGEIAQVDFGYSGMRLDPTQRVMRKTWIFVLTLAHSRLNYAEFVFDQKIDTWLACHVNAFECLAGVPGVIVPDNLKSAVIRAVFGADKEAVLNRSYRELARLILATEDRVRRKDGRYRTRFVAAHSVGMWVVRSRDTAPRARPVSGSEEPPRGRSPRGARGPSPRAARASGAGRA